MKVKIHKDEESKTVYTPFSVTLDDDTEIEGVIIHSVSCVGGIPTETVDIEIDESEYDLTGVDMEELTEQVINAYYEAVDEL